MGCFSLLFLLFGIVLPVAAWTVETSSHVCAEVFFNPLPTPLHNFLWLCLPASNLWLYQVLAGRTGPRIGLGLACGLGQGVALAYSLLFLPLLPVSVITVPFGYGLCSLSPLLALPVSLVAFRRLQARPSGRLLGVGLSVLLLCLGEMPAAVTYTGLHLAQGPAPTRGLTLLRDYGDHQLLLKACYQKPDWNNSLVGMLATLGSPPDPEEVRQIFYRAFGVPFNAYPPPPSARRFLDDEGMEWGFDADQAGEQVGGRVARLKLQESRLRGQVDATGSTVVWDWDMTFANGLGRAAEARARLRLPHGGVVSGATLWVEGQPRQALIASRAKARQAYEEVVSQQRDPLLVTTKEADQVLVQCFPVPMQGTMHIQVHVTAPLLVDGAQAYLKPPSFMERNFSLASPHQVALECALPRRGLEEKEVAAGGLASPELGAWVTRPWQPQVWCRDALGAFTAGRWLPVKDDPAPLWLVVDGSAPMRPYLPAVAQALRGYQSTQPLGVVLAGDEAKVVMPLGPAQPARLEEAARALEGVTCVGGQDPVPALAATQGRVLWVHGPQPVLLSGLEPLQARGQDILSLACTNGPNRVVEGLGCQEVVRTGPLRDDLARELLVASGQRADWDSLTMEPSAARPQGAQGADGVLSCLWAAGECLRLPAPEALKLAVRYHLVTPVSGAVVLESKEAEKRAGLTPGEASDIPVVPEPGPWVLLAALAGWVGVRRVLRR